MTDLPDELRERLPDADRIREQREMGDTSGDAAADGSESKFAGTESKIVGTESKFDDTSGSESVQLTNDLKHAGVEQEDTSAYLEIDDIPGESQRSSRLTDGDDPDGYLTITMEQLQGGELPTTSSTSTT